MSVTAIFTSDRKTSLPTKRSSSNSRAPRGKKGKKDDQFVVDQAQQLVSELNDRTNRPWYPSKPAVFERLMQIAARQIRNSNRFKRKGCRMMARRVVEFALNNRYVEFTECRDAKGRFTPEVTRLGEKFISSRSRVNHPSNNLVSKKTEAAA